MLTRQQLHKELRGQAGLIRDVKDWARTLASRATADLTVNHVNLLISARLHLEKAAADLDTIRQSL